ncbi:Nucleotidylyl transferase [Rickenella mellea]|uniref:ethanolamine-phosphate cytidylyltransferase n=1 Tax=Rickenella mellea TaxID=50990 RepID=A0A4Y7QN82_9AGAM|nr:Nucleotidylyl transferase [Rickenella mellea]
MAECTVLWLDGCFDGFHYAHANAIRQSLTLVHGPVEIIVGVHSDAEITKNKGPPLFDERERYDLIKGCRWVSRVVEDVPYVTQMDVFEKYGVDFVVHGDDPVMDADGNDCYAAAKALGKYKECRRTEGISTTSLIQRILRPELPLPDQAPLISLLQAFAASSSPHLDIKDLKRGHNNTTFAGHSDKKKIGYIGGSWDCFGSAHVDILQEARSTLAKGRPSDGVFLIVGVYSDEAVLEETSEKPLLLMYERALAVAQCLHTDALILNVPRDLGEAQMESFGIECVFLTNGEPSKTSARLSNVSIGKAASQLFTVDSLRTKVLGERGGYEERQRRKGG